MKFKWKVIVKDVSPLHGEQEWNTGPLHIAADLPAGIIQEVQAEIYHKSSEDEKIFMNGYQTWTVSPEYDRHSRIRGMHRIPKNLIDKYAFDRYADYHFVNYPYQKGITHGLGLISCHSWSNPNGSSWHSSAGNCCGYC
jgi:hypothetical protein